MTQREQTLRTLLSEVSRQDASRAGLDDDLVRELGLDSLAALRVLAAVEKRFGIRFPDERLAEFRTLRQLLDFISDKDSEGKQS
jgi:acyl carrier protein